MVVAGFCRAHRNVWVGVHHGKNTKINFTKMTSAKMTNREANTTELVAERPTPWVPPWLRIPWKHAIGAMIRPNTAVRKVGARKWLKLVPPNPECRNF